MFLHGNHQHIAFNCIMQLFVGKKNSLSQFMFCFCLLLFWIVWVLLQPMEWYTISGLCSARMLLSIHWLNFWNQTIQFLKKIYWKLIRRRIYFLENQKYNLLKSWRSRWLLREGTKLSKVAAKSYLYYLTYSKYIIQFDADMKTLSYLVMWSNKTWY
jgi:hypothetical protein